MTHLPRVSTCLRVFRLCVGRPQSDRASLLIPIFQLGISGAWPAPAAAQLQRKAGREGGSERAREGGREGKTNGKEGSDGRGEIPFHHPGCLVVWRKLC